MSTEATTLPDEVTSPGASSSAPPRASTAAAGEPMSMGAVLRIPSMRRLWYAQIVSTFGDFVALFAVITVMTFRMHASAQQVTGVQIAFMLPIAVLGIVSGVFVDRWPLKVTLVSSDLIRAALVVLLMVAHSFWGYYLALAAISIVSSVFGPAQGVAVRSLVPMSGMRAAQGLLQQVMFVMRIVGAPIAALLLTYFTPRASFIVDAVSFVASGALLSTLVLQPAPPKPGATRAKDTSPLAGVWADMKQGLSFIVHHAALLFVIVAMASGMFIMGCFAPLIAVYVRDTLHASTKLFGIASAMLGVGILTGINVLNSAGRRLGNTKLVYAGLLGMAAGTFILAGVAYPATTIAGLLLIGFSVGCIIIPTQTMIQQETPPAMLGRVGSTVMSVIFTAQIAGLLLSGVLANHTGVRHVFAFCGIMLLLLAIAGRVWMHPDEAPAPAS